MGGSPWRSQIGSMDSTNDREARLDKHVLILGSMAVALYGLAMVLVFLAVG